MNKYYRLIYLVGLLTILNTSSIAASKTLVSRDCPESLVKISVEDLPKTSKTNSILDYSNAIAEGKSTSDAAKASFWWAAEQFDPFNGKLVQNWVASPYKRQIDMTVDWQLWNLLDYFDRYRFVNQFGTVARNYGYSLNVFNQQNLCLASYKYNTDTRPPKWELNLEDYGEDSLQVEPLQRFNELKPL